MSEKRRLVAAYDAATNAFAAAVSNLHERIGTSSKGEPRCIRETVEGGTTKLRAVPTRAGTPYRAASMLSSSKHRVLRDECAGENGGRRSHALGSSGMRNSASLRVAPSALERHDPPRARPPVSCRPRSGGSASTSRADAMTANRLQFARRPRLRPVRTPGRLVANAVLIPSLLRGPSPRPLGSPAPQCSGLRVPGEWLRRRSIPQHDAQE